MPDIEIGHLMVGSDRTETEPADLRPGCLSGYDIREPFVMYWFFRYQLNTQEIIMDLLADALALIL